MYGLLIKLFPGLQGLLGGGLLVFSSSRTGHSCSFLGVSGTVKEHTGVDQSVLSFFVRSLVKSLHGI